MMSTIFTKNGRPFYPLGGQCMNSSAINPQDRMVFWRSLELLGANTAEIPVFWETVEPAENAFDFSIVDTLLQEAREREMQLILLWFGTWKNGMMKYVPGWVKSNPQRFRRAVRHDGAEVSDLSPACRENLEADKRAFCHLMEHLKLVDGTQRTVIAVQVQNEAGTLGCCRDYGPAASAAFDQPVPKEIAGRLPAAADTPIGKNWRENGAKAAGNWTDLFGPMADEQFNTWQVATYINEIARAGKEVYPLPMFVNVWMDEVGWDIPGIDYPAGCPVRKSVDLWKWAAPDIDLIGPDIYLGCPQQYDRACEAYSRPDNPLFVPESDCRRGLENWMNLFSAIGNYGAVGYCAFGTEHVVLADGSPHPDYADFIGSFRSVAAVLPLLEQHMGTDRITAVRQGFMTPSDYVDLGDYRARIDYDYGRTDYRHRLPGFEKEKGHGLIIKGETDEFFITGGGFAAYLAPKWSNVPFGNVKRDSTINYLLVEEGYFDREGSWQVTRLRTGDESDAGIWVYPDVGAVRVVMCP